METAAVDALEYSQQSQLTQTQPLSQPTIRFPPNLWGILVSVGRSSSDSFGLAHHAHDQQAGAPRDIPALAPLPGPSTDVHTALPRPERLEFSRTKREYTVGRHPRCDLVLNGPKISSKHARIWLDKETGIVRLEDTSTNGTFVRNMKVGKGNITVLEPGDLIVFGPASANFDDDFRYVFQCDPNLHPSSSSSGDPYGLGELSQSQNAEGRSIHQFYEVREQLGKGSFATVRKGVRRADGVVVAIKIIQRARFASNPKSVEMIEREIAIMMQLEHRFCVKCFDFFEDDQRIWIVLEYVDGGDLLDYVMKRRGLKENETREIALMICEAVAYLHSEGVTHRDLKPENLLLTKAAHPVCKVTDFGLAKMVDDQTMLRTMCGTPTYLAPEVILHPDAVRGYGSLVDAWSIGVVLYSCLTNQIPFDESESTPLPQRMAQRKVNLGILRGFGVSEIGCDFIGKLLKADPRERMSCAQALCHPWLATKSDPISSLPFSNSAPDNIPDIPAGRWSRADSLEAQQADADMSAASLTSPAAMRTTEGTDDSMVDSQGFGKLTLDGPPHSPHPLANLPNGLDHAPAPSFSSGTKRKEPMSAFSDSSISAMSSVQASPIMARAVPPGPLANVSMPPPPVRKRPAPEMQNGAMEAEEPERVETSEEAEPSTTEEGDLDLPPIRLVKIEASKVPEAPELAKMLEEDVVKQEVKEEQEEAPPTPARRGKGVRKAAATPARGRGRARDRASVASTTKDDEDVEGEREQEQGRGPAPKKQKTRASSASVSGAAAEVSGIAATVKNRRRKAARYT
ncbi:ser/thr/tyr protein kinase RAD53 [Rhodotorula toruloides]|uniref:Ser/thr/tyr protein kinase RAD53 n=1 Tax=Rhodotorula toruloides TaxID=5286 RepID=A0A511KD91_RHOTO|nr:ser/thr/tyr protein kinase RAD53 [Rhodotorula toruloides]